MLDVVATLPAEIVKDQHGVTHARIDNAVIWAGEQAVSPGQLASSIRAWAGFLMQDEPTPDATLSQVTPQLVERFGRWRMGAHRYAVRCAASSVSTSPGVKGRRCSGTLTISAPG